MIFAIPILLILQIWRTSALPTDHVNATVEASIDAGTFQSPSSNIRPKFRYWIPDGSINTTYLADDIHALAQRGAGGTEFLNYFQYGGLLGPPPPEVDWNIYGFGTPAYLNVLEAALQATKDNGLTMDFSLGPQSGQGVPADPKELGLSWEMVSFNTTLNGSYDGQLPGWGMGDLLSAVTFSLVENASIVPEDYVLYLGGAETKLRYTIGWQSLTEVTDLVSRDGHITIQSTTQKASQPNLLFASYARRSYTRACIASSENPQNILQNGSFAVDHFSATGAKLTTDFLENYILVGRIKELLVEAGNYIWEDSVEVREANIWTPGLEHIFQQRNGYSMTKYLPLLWGYSGDLAIGIPPIEIVSDTPSIDDGFLADLRSTITELYATYLNHFVNWTHSVLDLQFSAQVGYNLPLDMLASIPLVDAPETETLSFLNNIDSYRQYTGPADLAGKRIISIELGADYTYPYTQTLTQLLFDGKRALVAGVNQFVIHGATYSHTYPNTTWPGFTTFGYSFGGQHSRHQPAWDVGYPEAINWMARTLWVLQTGIPKVDLVFWDKQLAQNPYPNTTYAATDLAEVGYAYSYLTAENFELDAAQVFNGELAPSRQGFKALILRGNETLTVRGVDRLVDFARSGFPIFISGGVPTRYATSNGTAIALADSQVRSILNLTNVHQIPEGPVGNAIRSAGVMPRTRISSNGNWLTRWREDQDGEIYVFVYNDGNYSTGNISFATTSTPYFLDAWTGTEEPVLLYSTSNGYTTLPLSLSATQAVIFKFSNKVVGDRTMVHVKSAPSAILGFTYINASKAVTAKVPRLSSAAMFGLSNGTSASVSVATSIPPAYPLTNWSLRVEKWLPPSDLYDVEPVANKTNETYALPGPTLPSWPAIQGLSNTSGIGFYTVNFTWPPPQVPASSDLGAYLDIPPASQGLQGFLNGQQLPTLDITDPQVDITSFLVRGMNELELVASTTLFNGLRPIWDQLVTSGGGPQLTLEQLVALGSVGMEQPYGIVGTVTVVPYQAVRII